MTVRVYRWDDAGAPTLNGGVGSLVALLRAVLVGTAGVAYGSKASSGWTEEWTGTNEAAFKNGGTGFGIKVTHTAAARTATFVGYESISGGATTNPFPTAAQLSTGLYVLITNDGTPYTTNNRPWMIVADNKRFYLYIGFDNTTAQGIAGSTTANGIYFAGDITTYRGDDAYHFAVIGNNGTSNGYFTFAGTSSVTLQSGHYMARDYTQTGTSKAIGKTPITDNGANSGYLGATSTTTPYPDPVSGGMLLSRIAITETYNRRGHLPGCWSPLHNLPGNPGDTFSGTGDLSGRTFVLVDCGFASSRGRVALETSDTWD